MDIFEATDSLIELTVDLEKAGLASSAKIAEAHGTLNFFPIKSSKT
jgi:hypothetical protein